MRDVVTLEVAFRRDVPVAADEVHVAGLDDARDLGGRPDEVPAFLAFAVGVGGGVEAALGIPHVAQQVVERLLGDAPEPRLAGHLEGLEIEPGQLSVVVEHFLEMRHEPVGIDRVAVEAAADLVVQATLCHAPAGEEHRVQQVGAGSRPALAEEELEHRRMRELRRAAEAAAVPVDGAEKPFGGATHEARVRRLVARARLLRAFERGQDPVDGARDLVGTVAIRARHRLEQARESRQAVAVDRREVRSAVEGLPVRREKDRHRPAATPGEHLDGFHVHIVDVGPLLAIDLHVDEELVHEPRGVLVLERLPFHHVTPVAGGVADGQENRPVLGARPRERLLAPRIPVDRVVRVLEEVGARLGGETVRFRFRPHVRIVAPDSGRRNARACAPSLD